MLFRLFLLCFYGYPISDIRFIGVHTQRAECYSSNEYIHSFLLVCTIATRTKTILWHPSWILVEFCNCTFSYSTCLFSSLFLPIFFPLLKRIPTSGWSLVGSWCGFIFCSLHAWRHHWNTWVALRMAGQHVKPWKPWKPWHQRA